MTCVLLYVNLRLHNNNNIFFPPNAQALHNFTDPLLTSHLQLRMDKASFFFDGYDYSEDEVRRWLAKRTRVVINDAHANISTSRVTYLVQHGFLDAVTDIIVADCHCHRDVLQQLASLRLYCLFL